MFESCRDRQRSSYAFRNNFNSFFAVLNLFVTENSRCIADSVCSAGYVQLQGVTNCAVCSVQHRCNTDRSTCSRFVRRSDLAERWYES
jgi:hypothetical protein